MQYISIYPIRFLSAEEEIITTYKFGVYDLLVLSPSFPYGGMVSVFYVSHYYNKSICIQENACLSFLTPSKFYINFWTLNNRHQIALLAGDRSLVDVVVHELTHSWFGNGVTYVI